MMGLLYEISAYIRLLIILVAVILAFTWKKQRGKGLICTFLLLMFISSFLFIVLRILFKIDFLDRHIGLIVNIVNPAGMVLLIVSNIFLLCFVIVMRKAALPDINTSPGILQDITNLSEKEKRSILRRREWTYVLDNILANIVCFFIVLVIGVAGGMNDSSEQAVILLVLLFSISYFLFKDSFSGKSLGKLITGLRVVDINNGRPIGPGKSVARNWLFLLPLMPLVELIVANVREDKRRLGDLLANTIVIKDNQAREHQTDSTYTLQTSISEKNEEAKDKTSSSELEQAKEQYVYLKCQCGQRVKISGKFAGKVGRCPKCSASIKVPEV